MLCCVVLMIEDVGKKKEGEKRSHRGLVEDKIEDEACVVPCYVNMLCYGW